MRSGVDDVDRAFFLDAVQPLCEHEQFVEDVLEALQCFVPNILLSYNDLPLVAADALGTWDTAELLEAATIVWTPAVPRGGLSVDDQRWVATLHLDEHPTWRRGARMLYRNSDCVERARWQRTALYNELHRPMGIASQASMHVQALPGRQLSLVYNREGGDFDDLEMRRLGQLQPVVSRCFRDHWRYLEIAGECAMWRRTSESDDLGRICISGQGLVRWASRRARAWLDAHGLSLVRGELPAALVAWLRPVIEGRAATVPWFCRRSGGRELSIAYHPDDGNPVGAMLCLREAPVSIARDHASDHEQGTMHALADAFGLTARESQVALWIGRGKSNQDIATILGIRPATVKKHAERIFVKLGVENRTSVANNICSVIATSGAPL